MFLDSEHVFVTRNARTYKRVRSPIASLADRLYSLLVSRSPEGASLRSGFAWSIAKNDPGSSSSSRAELRDRLIASFLAMPPAIVVLQGVYEIFDSLTQYRQNVGAEAARNARYAAELS